MRNLKHKIVIAVVATALIGGFWFTATSHRTTQAAVPAAPRAVVEPVALVEMRPIVPAERAEAMRGKDGLNSTSRTDW